MSFNLGGRTQDTKTNQSGTATGTMSSTSNPWAATTPYLNQFLGQLGGASSGLGTVSPGQAGAIGEMSANAGRAAQWVPDIESLTRDLFSTTSTSPMAADAYGQLQTRLGGYADGTGVNPMDDPAFKTLLDSVSSDAMNRTNSMFAGAGRDLSPENSAAAARAVTNAQAPIIIDQYNNNIGRQIGAATTLYGAGQETATNIANLDAQAQGQRERGISTAAAALEALNLPAQIRLELENTLKTLPIEELGLVAQQLFAAAGLGSSTSGAQSQAQKQSGTSNTSGTQWGLNLQWPSTPGAGGR